MPKHLANIVNDLVPAPPISPASSQPLSPITPLATHWNSPGNPLAPLLQAAVFSLWVRSDRNTPHVLRPTAVRRSRDAPARLAGACQGDVVAQALWPRGTTPPFAPLGR